MENGNKPGPAVNGYSDFAGVLGTGVYVTGIAGTSINNSGVYGQTGEDPDSLIPPNVQAGVFGVSNTSEGVCGVSISKTGVAGYSWDRAGVSGASENGIGVSGINSLGRGSGVVGFCGMEHMPGPTQLSNLPPAGVHGRSFGTPGVIGESDNHVGVVGVSKNIGVYGQGSNFAGVFEGNILVTGAKSAVVPFPDGTRRVLYCMESPELWFEDFGAAKLKSGRALVKLDADFAKVIKRGDYRVFMTPEGDCRGLYVHRKRANTFEVRELGGGKSNIAFSYRIVGRRKDIKGRRRFAKVDMGLPLLPAAPRKSAPTAARLRALIADVANELGQRGRTKGAEKARGSRVLPRGSRPSIRPQLPRARARKK